MDGFGVPVNVGGQVFIKPADDRTSKYLGGRIGEVLALSITEDRDLVEHNRFFAILRACVHHLPQYAVTDNQSERIAVEDLRIALAYETGFVKTSKDLQGRDRVFPRSMSFKNTSEAEFRDFREKAYAVLCRVLGCSLDDLLKVGLQ